MDEHHAETDISQLVAQYHRGVYGYAYRLTGSVPDAEDLTQQVFLTAQQKLGQLRNVESARTWLFTILRNCFLKSCKRRRPVTAGSMELNLNCVPDEIPPEKQISPEQLQAVLNQLPEKYRLVLAMFYYEDCSYRDIAEQLDVPIGTVMSRLARAKSQLRSKLFGIDRAPPLGPQEKAASQRG